MMYNNVNITPNKLHKRINGYSENEIVLMDVIAIKVAYKKDKIINKIFNFKTLLFLLLIY